ncbi:TonB-dependent siderophore receptor [Amorphus sp. 3PC139-8]|uniref:TonB-dependent siderophore receptor n=1 Tax=Amorphus sp. 3PC139-8 TaxID=2735676 RepID=UPI00345D3254
MVRRATRRRTSAAFTLALCFCTAAQALVAAPDARAQQSAQAIAIPAGSLSAGLNRLAMQTGVHLGFDTAHVGGKRTKGLSGTYTLEEALDRLLAGTGLRYQFDGRIVTIAGAFDETPASAGLDPTGAVVLDEISVSGSGGVILADGYVGLSSATGAKVDTPFVETPQSISSVTEQQIKDRNPQSLLDAISYTPGARVNAYGTDPRFDSFFVRGFNVSNTGVFRDNLRQPVAGYGYFLTEPYGLEGISILRGPASALYGATGAGGLYNVISKRPTKVPFHEVQLQLGTDNRYQGQFDLSGPVSGSDTVFYRLTGLGRSADTEFESVADDRYFFAPALTWQPDAATKLTLLAEVSRSDTGGNPAYYNDYYGHVSPFEAGDPAYDDMTHDQARIGWEFEHALSDTVTVRQNARYSTQSINTEYVYTYNGPQHALNPALIDRGNGHDNQRLDAFVVDNQVQLDVATGPVEHTMLFGLDLSATSYSGLTGSGTIAPLNTAALNYGGYIPSPAYTSRTDQDQLQVGIYAQDQLRYGPWLLTLTGRHDWVRLSSDYTDLTTGDVEDLDQDDGEYSFRAGLTYLTPFGLAPYVSYSTAFSPNIGWNTTTNAPFEPTTSVQEEVGVKYLMSDYNVMMSAAFFNIDQENGLFYEVINGVNTQVQRGKLQSRGVELEATASLGNGLSFTGSYSYTQLKIIEGPADTIDNYVSSVPEHMAALWADYTLPLDTPFAGLSLGAGVRYIGKSYGDDTNTLVNEPRTLVDAAARYDFGEVDPKLDGLQLQVNATNLFDVRDTTCTGGYCYLDPGRTVIGSLVYRW